MNNATLQRHCEVCRGPLRNDNRSGICRRTAECDRVRAERVRRARGIEPLGQTLRTRLFSGLEITPSGCVLWTGALDDGGYGKIKVGDRTRGPHIIMWELHEDPVPGDMELDHLCHGRDLTCPGTAACLQVVTRLTNTRRAYARLATRVTLGRPHSSQYTGVTRHRQSGKWQAAIGVAGRNRYLGLYASEEEAALAYNTAALEIESTLEGTLS